MIEPAKFNSVVSFLWAIADLLNGAFQKSEFQKIILPFTVLRRLDYALEATKAKVLETEHTLKEKGLENRHEQLCRAAGYAFYNTSKFNYESLLHDDANLALNLRQYVMGFSPNVREIFAAFNFDDAIRDLERAGLLYLLMERFNERSKVDLRPAAMSNHGIGYVFEHLLRKFNEALNQNPGEHFTPREVIRLMVDLVLMFDTDLASGEGVARTVNDCCCGTGGRLTLTKDRIQQINPQAKVFRYGQDKTARRQRRFGLAQRARRVRRRGKPPKQLNPQTWAIARSDMLILEPEGKDAENIKLGSTLSNDPLPDKRFDFQFVNRPYGYEWSKDFDAVTTEAARGFDGRFGAGLPRKSDGQMLFLQHFIAWMNDAEDAQSYIGIIMNGSPLFTDSDTALRGSAFLQSEPSPQVVSEAKDNFHKDEDMRWQPSGARQIAKGNSQGERGGVHQFGVPPKGNANFAWVQHFIHECQFRTLATLRDTLLPKLLSGELSVVGAEQIDGRIA